jgi:hypothetical protein
MYLELFSLLVWGTLMECKGKRLRMKKKEQLIDFTKLGKIKRRVRR